MNNTTTKANRQGSAVASVKPTVIGDQFETQDMGNPAEEWSYDKVKNEQVSVVNVVRNDTVVGKKSGNPYVRAEVELEDGSHLFALPGKLKKWGLLNEQGQWTATAITAEEDASEKFGYRLVAA